MLIATVEKVEAAHSAIVKAKHSYKERARDRTIHKVEMMNS